MSRRRIASADPRRVPARGFTLVEVIIAVVILSIAVLALAGTASVVGRLLGGTRQEVLAASIASSRFERLRGESCALASSGTQTVGAIREDWTVATVDPSTLDVNDSVSFRPLSGHATVVQAYRSYVRC